MRGILDRLKEIDATLCDQMNVRLSFGETTITDPTLRRLAKAREGVWIARRALDEEEEEPCGKS